MDRIKAQEIALGMIEPSIVNNFKNSSKIFNNKIELARQFCNTQPIYYDKAGLFWLWNNKEKYWEMFDETDILNMLHLTLGTDTINSKERTEILQALKQVGRLNKPKDLPCSWIQFKNGIVDLNNPIVLIEATSEYFTVNPMPWNIGKTDSTPIMDKVFEEWVGRDYVKTLYQILAYSLLPDYPIHRIFCFIGSGMNGKSKFLDLLRNFVGYRNVCSTELDSLIISRFEVAKLYKKLVCQMGETNFGELSKTSMLKKLSGGDLIGFEYKNKNPFEDKNYAKIIISTNNLPATTDKTIGFYRRWMIIDFPNQFSEKKDILLDIPMQEYENLCLKSINILSQLLSIREFHKEGTIEDRMKRYEEKSNFVERFMKEFTTEDFNGYITKSAFYKKFSEWSKENRHREMSETSVGMTLKNMGITEDRKYFDWLYDGKGGQARVWSGITWK
jgi:P4 family phage/plasmid primase-like protien